MLFLKQHANDFKHLTPNIIMYYVNEKLFRSIYLIHGMSQKEFSAYAFGAKQFYPHRLGEFHLLTVNDIIKLCNATHIPIRHFFCGSKNGTMPSSLDAIKVKGEWQDITVDFDQLRKISVGDGYGFSRQELLAFLKVDVSCLWRWINTSFKMRAQVLCDMCNEFGIDLADIIKDHNAIIPTASPSKYTSKTLDQIERMKRRMVEQQQTINNHEQNIEQLENERDTALDEAAKAKSGKTVVKTKYITEPEEDAWKWQSDQWPYESIPTLSQLIAHCNRQHTTTLPFLANPKHKYNASTIHAANGDDYMQTAEEAIVFKSIITIDYMAYTMIAKSIGITDTPDTISIVKFCRILNENNITPAFCINDTNSNYPTTLPDRMARALGSAGITA